MKDFQLPSDKVNLLRHFRCREVNEGCTPNVIECGKGKNPEDCLVEVGSWLWWLVVGLCTEDTTIPSKVLQVQILGCFVVTCCYSFYLRSRFCVCVCHLLFQRGSQVHSHSEAGGAGFQWLTWSNEAGSLEGKWLRTLSHVPACKKLLNLSNQFYPRAQAVFQVDWGGPCLFPKSTCCGLSILPLPHMTDYVLQTTTWMHPSSSIHLTSVWVPVDFRKPHIGTAPGVILASRGIVRIQADFTPADAHFLPSFSRIFLGLAFLSCFPVMSSMNMSAAPCKMGLIVGEFAQITATDRESYVATWTLHDSWHLSLLWPCRDSATVEQFESFTFYYALKACCVCHPLFQRGSQVHSHSEAGGSGFQWLTWSNEAGSLEGKWLRTLSHVPACKRLLNLSNQFCPRAQAVLQVDWGGPCLFPKSTCCGLSILPLPHMTDYVLQTTAWMHPSI